MYVYCICVVQIYNGVKVYYDIYIECSLPVRLEKNKCILYCVYPAISKSPKQMPNFMKIAEPSVVSSVSELILLPFLSVALYKSGTRNALLGPILCGPIK
jgi:hypothetical protein